MMCFGEGGVDQLCLADLGVFNRILGILRLSHIGPAQVSTMKPRIHSFITVNMFGERSALPGSNRDRLWKRGHCLTYTEHKLCWTKMGVNQNSQAQNIASFSSRGKC